jgi:uncharacterized HAD superfamily protein
MVRLGPLPLETALIGEIRKKMNDMLQEAEEDGKKISPILPAHIKNFLIDIDGTVGEDIPNEEPERMEDAGVYPDGLQKCNQWYDEGHVIYFFTSRTEAHRDVTERWLKKNGFKYHGIIFGKPRGGNYHWIDNHMVRATRFEGKFTDLVEKEMVIQVFKNDE